MKWRPLSQGFDPGLRVLHKGRLLLCSEKLEMCCRMWSLWKMRGFTCIVVFWRYELQNMTTIPIKEGVSGSSNDMDLKNYSKVWNASKTKSIWNLIHLKAAWCYYDNVQQALRWLFYFQTGVKLRGWMKGVYVSWELSIFKIATEPWRVDRYKQRKLDIWHCHDSVP